MAASARCDATSANVGWPSPSSLIVATWRSARKDLKGLREQDVRERLVQFEPLWDQLFPAEQARIVQLLVERIDLGRLGPFPAG
jgi:hypothetical protein